MCDQKTHKSTNYPIILSGGKNLGFKHGSHLRYGDKIPLSNLFVTIANQLAGPTENFSDSTSDLRKLSDNSVLFAGRLGTFRREHSPRVAASGDTNSNETA